MKNQPWKSFVPGVLIAVVAMIIWKDLDERGLGSISEIVSHPLAPFYFSLLSGVFIMTIVIGGWWMFNKRTLWPDSPWDSTLGLRAFLVINAVIFVLAIMMGRAVVNNLYEATAGESYDNPFCGEHSRTIEGAPGYTFWKERRQAECSPRFSFNR